MEAHRDEVGQVTSQRLDEGVEDEHRRPQEEHEDKQENQDHVGVGDPLDALCTPEMAERMNAAVRMAMTTIASPTASLPPKPNMAFRPWLICRAPNPSEVADPNSVANMARMFIVLPIGPCRPEADRTPC